ncbi:MAG: hypothetical protein ACKVQR_21095 [Aquabacterium sp.]
MARRSLWRTTIAAMAMACMGYGAFAQASEDEARMRQQLQAALWPADIVRLADDYLRQHPDSSWRIVAEGMKLGAADSMRALNRSDVALYRSSFRAATPDDGTTDDLRQAAMGDRDAAMRLAVQSWRADRNEARYVGWLQLASTLGHDKATYELALHFRRNGQPALAAQYESRALEMGYEPPPWLDHRRK